VIEHNRLDRWVRLPSGWIQRGGLRGFEWEARGAGADNIAALMALLPIAHAANRQSGIAQLTYSDLCDATALSRAKLSNGLDILSRIGLIERSPDGRSTHRLANYGPGHRWAKLPAKSMYGAGTIAAFSDFALRRRTELDALKLFLLFVARRGNDTNRANISYDKIVDYSGVERPRIKSAISLLTLNSLIYVEQVQSLEVEGAVAHAYRIIGIDSYNHMGTSGRAST
jgi:hypothetical protein